MNPNDIVRRQVLRYFYDRNEFATSQFGKRGSAVRISDIKRDLKTRYGLTQPQVQSNLTYLRSRGWLNKFDVEKTVRVKGGTVPSTVTWYEITAQGIEKIEGESEFTPREPYRGINISGQNVVTFGDGNVVNVQFHQLFSELDKLNHAVIESDALTEVQKLGAVADIQSIRGQLAKDSPNRSFVDRLWQDLERVLTLANLTEYVARVAPLIANLPG